MIGRKGNLLFISKSIAHFNPKVVFFVERLQEEGGR